MTVSFLEGNLLDDDAEALVNAVNCVGAMGAGIALAFRIKFPEMFEAYRRDCEEKHYRTGIVRTWEYYEDEKTRYVLNFPTMYYPGTQADLTVIEQGLSDLAWVVGFTGIKSVAIPALGCGIGGLSWFKVKHAITDVFDKPKMSHIDTRVYVPLGTPIDAIKLI